MAEALGAAGSIAEIVGFGLQIATTIQTYNESFFEAEDRLREIAFIISSTASTLSQLQEVLEAEKAIGDGKQGPRVFKDEGIKQIEALVVQCDRVCKSAVLFILKARAGGGKAKLAIETLDVRTFTASFLSGSLKWAWLEPRIKRCQEKLIWLNMHLLLYLQLASLVRLQIQKDGRPPGSFDEELAQRIMTDRLKQRTAKYTKKLASKFKKVDDVESCAEVETIASVDSTLEDTPMDPFLESNAEEIKKEDLPTVSRSTGQHSEHPASVKSDAEIDPSPLYDAAEIGGKDTDNPPLDLKGTPESITEVQTSGTVAGDTEEPNAHQTTIEDAANEEPLMADKTADEETFIQDKVPPPHLTGRTEDPGQDIPNTKPPLFKQTELFEDLKKEQIAETENQPEIASFPFYEPSSGARTSWFKRLIGKHDKFLHDWESQVLEAFVVHKDSSTPVKVPFGHQRLTFGLKQVMKNDSYLSWDQYLLLGSEHHRVIDQIIADAKRADSRQRTFLALVRKQGLNQDEDRILVFFSLGGLGEAANLTHTMGRKLGFSFGRNRTSELRIRIMETELAILRAEVERPAKAAEQARIDNMKVIRFKDAVGRRFSFPFHTCKTWSGMEELIKQAFLHVEVIGPHVAEGHYDLVGPNGEIILPQVWELMVEPDWAVTMHMWPMPEPPKPAPNLPPPALCCRGPPPPPPAWIGPPVRVQRCRCQPSSNSSDSDSYFSDSDSLVSDSDIDDEGLDEELQTGIDFEKEEEKAEVPLGELLSMWTNATDTSHKIVPRVVKAELTDSDSESDSDFDTVTDD